MYSVVSVLYRLFALSGSRFNLQEYCRSFFVHLCYFSEFKVSGRNLTTQPGRSYNALPITSAGLRCTVQILKSFRLNISLRAETAETHRTLAEVAQRNSLRAMANYDKKSSAQLYDEFNICAVQKRWRERDSIWLYRILKDDPLVPRYIKNLISFTENPHNVRFGKRIAITGNSAMINKTFTWRLKVLFEALPEGVWCATNVESLRKVVFPLL